MIVGSLATILIATSSRASAQTAVVGDKVPTPYGDEYVVTINGVEGRWVLPEHVREIKENNDKLAAAQKTILAMADEIASLKRQTQLEAKLDALNTTIIGLKNDQLAQFRLLSAGQDKAQAALVGIRGEQPPKSFLDKLPVKFLFAGASFVSNVKSLYVREPSPCAPIPAMGAGVTLRFGKK